MVRALRAGTMGALGQAHLIKHEVGRSSHGSILIVLRGNIIMRKGFAVELVGPVVALC